MDTRHIQHMATLKEYRFARDSGREPPPKDEELTLEEEKRARPGVVGAIEKAREAAASKGPGGAHAKIKDAKGVVVDAVLKFGRHKGKKLSEIKSEEPSYIAWLLGRPYDAATRPDGFPPEFIEIVRRFA